MSSGDANAMGKIIAALLSLPFLIMTMLWIFGCSVNPTSEKIGQGGELIAQAAIPWWLQVIEFLAALGAVGALLAVLFLIVLSVKGEIG